MPSSPRRHVLRGGTVALPAGHPATSGSEPHRPAPLLTRTPPAGAVLRSRRTSGAGR